MLGHPQQVRVVRGGDDADQVRAVVLLQPVSITGPGPTPDRPAPDRPAPVSPAPVSPAPVSTATPLSAEAGGGLPLPARPVNAGTVTGSSTWRATGRPTSTAIRS